VQLSGWRRCLGLGRRSLLGFRWEMVREWMRWDFLSELRFFGWFKERDEWTLFCLLQALPCGWRFPAKLGRFAS